MAVAGRAVIARDKQLHAAGGAAIAFAAGLIVHVAAPATPLWLQFIAALAPAVSAGLIKEAYDLRHRDSHTPDPHDFLATALGGVAGAITINVLMGF